jgi:hypothetical protein
MKLDIKGYIKDYDGLPILQDKKPLAIKNLLRMYAGSYVPPPSLEAGGNAVIASAIGLKIHEANGEIELTDEEYKILKEAVSTPLNLGAIIYTQVRNVVFAAEKSVKK